MEGAELQKEKGKIENQNEQVTIDKAETREQAQNRIKSETKKDEADQNKEQKKTKKEP